MSIRPSTLSISDLIHDCPAPVSDDAGVTNALYWNDLVLTFAITQTEELIPNRSQIINDCNLFHPLFIVTGKDYGTYNNALMHVKSLLDADLEVYPLTSST